MKLLRARVVIFVVLLLVVLLTSFVVTHVINNRWQMAERQNISAKINNTVQTFETMLSDTNQTLNLQVQVLSNSLALNRGLANLRYGSELRLRLKQFKKSLPWVDAVYVIDPSGYVVEGDSNRVADIERSQLLKERLQTPGQSWFGLVDERQLLPVGARESSSSSIVRWQPLFLSGPNDKEVLSGYLLVISGSGQLLQQIAPHLSSDQGVSLLLGTTPLTHTGPESYELQPLVSQSQWHLTDGQPGNSFMLQVQLKQDVAWLQENARQTVFSLYEVLLPIISLVLLLAYGMSMQFDRGFKALMQLVIQFRQGNYEITPAKYQPLTFELRQALHMMYTLGDLVKAQLRDLSSKNQELAQLGEQLQLANTELESKVAERTKQLTLAKTRLEAQAFSDALTGVGNRLAFDRALQRATGSLQSFSLFIIDVNGLKTTNDRLGHQAGDELICSVARLLESSCRDEDRLYRIGGDEFALLVQGGREKVNQLLASRLSLAAVDKQWHPPVTGFPSRLYSFGFASSQEVSVADVFATADSRMYQDKQAFYASCAETESESINAA